MKMNPHFELLHDEIQLFLSLCGFNVLKKTIDKETLWITAQLCNKPQKVIKKR